jgi:hypothetical protein
MTTDITSLGYKVTTRLNIPADAFDNGMAVLLVTGGSYGGAWVMNALPVDADGVRNRPCGSIETDPAERQPGRALTAVRAWLEDYCEGTPFSLLHFESMNHTYGPDEAPFFSSAKAIIAIPMG